MFSAIPLAITLLAGCGTEFVWEPGYDPARPTAISDHLVPLDLDFEDAFYVTATVDGAQMVGVLASTFPDACEAYTSFVPVAAEAYDNMLDMDGGQAEFDALQVWQDAMMDSFPVGGATFFAAIGVDQLSTASVVNTFQQTLDLSSSTVGDTQGGQPSGTFVADISVLAEGMNVPCLYTGQCEQADVDASWQAADNMWGADAGTLSVTRYEAHGRLEGSGQVSLVNRWIDADFGVPAPLGDASFSFELKECEGLDARIFRFWTFI